MINCIYLHIPFCKKKCKYCVFCSFALLGKKDEYINCLIKEINHFYKNNPLKTIYFGGGTPSLLDICDVEKILKPLNYNSSTEVTFELNPVDVTIQKLKGLKDLGINRLSLGVQSFDDDFLFEIGRRHKNSDTLNALNLIKNTGFNNYSIDLIYGLPNQTLAHFEKTLNIALSLDIPHISLYGLKIEKGSYYYKFPPKNLPNSDLQASMYELACKVLAKKYNHYEFSNFALGENFYSKHNLCYWNRESYFGFGLGASGFIQNKRYTNTQNYINYIKDPLYKDFEPLTTKEQIEEEIFLGLRKSEGLDFSKINKKYNIDIFEKYKPQFEKFINQGFLKKTEKGVKLTLQGVLVSNEILCEFIEI